MGGSGGWVPKKVKSREGTRVIRGVLQKVRSLSRLETQKGELCPSSHKKGGKEHTVRGKRQGD